MLLQATEELKRGNIYESGGSLGYRTYHTAATKIASAKLCSFIFELNNTPIIKV
ncbi:Flavohemoprotein-Flavohemoglobin-Hemoglobin-like protein-Nitric oxide dioxygenase [Moritella viscosa]|uniref:Flavohemoprotein-Flavohemoglobin-Hemoglobin-like protein-Nitric oxide dioxygenase n=1 Tax=Moritella viscosa TaxID=80854 RepID=A0A1L0C6M3_9GAMM|nr:Flavohemoprotein-Flavohemoglobin-Hemoglobin-like protein-Nitric oxide dioxygenase [Moritella viscosa]SGZ00636.1 Flavohemoprotein-Flavohemoglobin-Hemoglobin-like protein-Nitric oxide dioxygenase [Moritella viscosa]SGZ01154.1 Flavohemoprotein-Flavohemoglobin-Hemoglobin-like protein-Nitric oxide dioxygenase [Moritella viscosa]SGZ10036.1 Flavohemoprotein-Flavohemoglobin-Hemoglobin-like protein-Nitric oxide dioxygenase [Moritella viscosa]SHO06379.1 Flavohemoprotein-Flavohemoglobin-Hemoglobin-like